MLVEEFMENFVTQFKAVEDAFEEARAELNSVDLPEGVGPLRLSLEEIGNIVVNAGGFQPRDPASLDGDELASQQLIEEGLDELTEQFYLHQYPATVSEVMADFHRDMVTLIRLNPTMMKGVSAIVRHLKTETSTRLSVSRKFERLLAMTEELLGALPDDTPDYVLRILDEVADFSQCMALTVDKVEKIRPLPANDNLAVA